MMNTRLHLKGFTVVELLIYIGILSAVFSIIFFLLSDATRIMGKVKEQKDIRTSATLALERMVQEVRDAQSVDVSRSSFGNEEGVLMLMTTDEEGSPSEVSFGVHEGVVEMTVNGTSRGALTLDSVVVSSLKIYRIHNARSEAVTFDLELFHEKNPEKIMHFGTTALMRGSY